MNNKLLLFRTNSSLRCAAILLTLIALTACSVAQNETDKQPQNDQASSSATPIVTPPQVESKSDIAQQLLSQQHQAVKPQARAKRKNTVAKRMLLQNHISYAYANNQDTIRFEQQPVNREQYAHLDQNSIKRVAEQPVSTFSIDVDTAAYSNMRRFLNTGSLPRKDVIRVEELVNYFNYQYPLPKDNSPFSLTTEIAVTPWNKNSYLLHIGIKGIDVAAASLPSSNLVFLVDVSGSMRSPNKLELLKTSLKLLSKRLRAQDKISIVVYAGASGVVLEPTNGNNTATISAALDNLVAGGSTNGAAGIKLAYSIAEQAFIKDGINRIILATDGDFNVGTVNFEALTDLIEQKRQTGISLTTLGFGRGNYNDKLMEQLADKGNGNYHYIDTLNEAQKVLVDEMSSTLQTIAKDVKIQIEFNPLKVAEYRLIGYENRLLKREDFNNDKVDAGDIGAGHTVTALYEITLADSKLQSVDALRYSSTAQSASLSNTHIAELAMLKIRYKAPDQNTSSLISWPLKLDSIVQQLSNTTDRFRFAAAVAAFGQKLKGGIYTKSFSYTDILELARHSRGTDNFGYRGEFIKLVNLAKSLS